MARAGTFIRLDFGRQMEKIHLNRNHRHAGAHPMNKLSAIISIILGLAVLGLTYSTYHRTFESVQAGGRFAIFGFETGASSTELLVGFAVAGLIGAALVIRGVMAVIRGDK